MWLRILIGGLCGGILVFCTGAFNHMVLGLQGRTLHNVPDGASFVEDIKGRDLKPGLYMFPDIPTGAAQAAAAADDTPASLRAAREHLYKAANERHKARPPGMLVTVRPGHDMMPGETLPQELPT